MEQVFINIPAGMTILISKTGTRLLISIEYMGAESLLEYPAALGKKGLKQAVVNAIEKVTHG